MFNLAPVSINFKSCPRCRGDMVKNQDYYGQYYECAQCGYIRDIGEPSLAKLKASLGRG
jgi:DNA-directed RNA polymerase subunit M/transcription elongation factor TFIIS